METGMSEEKCKIKRTKVTFLIFFLSGSLGYSSFIYDSVYLRYSGNWKPCVLSTHKQKHQHFSSSSYQKSDTTMSGSWHLCVCEYKKLHFHIYFSMAVCSLCSLRLECEYSHVQRVVGSHKKPLLQASPACVVFSLCISTTLLNRHLLPALFSDFDPWRSLPSEWLQ